MKQIWMFLGVFCFFTVGCWVRSSEEKVSRVLPLTKANLALHNQYHCQLEQQRLNRYLLNAAASGDDKRVKELLGNPYLDVNYCDGNGISVLQWAVLGGHTQVVKEVLGRRDLDRCYRHKATNKTALDVAREKNFTEISELLKTVWPVGSNDSDSDKSNWGAFVN